MTHHSEPNSEMPNQPTNSAVSVTAEEVEQALQRLGYPDLRSILCLIQDSKVTLRGTVPTYHLKQLAQTAAKRVAGVRAVKNEITVDFH